MHENEDFFLLSRAQDNHDHIEVSRTGTTNDRKRSSSNGSEEWD